MIRTTTQPLIGICFGCELMVHAFGGTLRELKKTHKGIKEIALVSPGLFGEKNTISVFENHHWITDSIPSCFEVLAQSPDGPEMMRHTALPMYGLQFHPENCVEQTEGDEIFLSLVSRLIR